MVRGVPRVTDECKCCEPREKLIPQKAKRYVMFELWEEPHVRWVYWGGRGGHGRRVVVMIVVVMAGGSGCYSRRSMLKPKLEIK